MPDSINKAIVIDVRLTDKEIISNMSELADKMSVIKTRMSENKQETQAQKDAYQTLKTELKSVTKEYNVLASVQAGQVTASNEKLNGSYVQLSENLKKLDYELKTAPGLIKQNADGTTTLTEKYFELQKQADDAQKTILLFNAGISQGRLNVGNYDNTLNGMRLHLEDLRVAMQGINVDTPEYKQAKDDADNLSLSIDQLTGKVDEFGNREPRNPAKKAFDDAFESSVALTQGISLITSLSKDNEDVQQQLAKAMQAVAIAQTAANILKSKGAILDTLANVKKTIAIGLEKAYAIAVGTSTGAVKALRIAIASTGIGLLVFGVVQLIQSMQSWTNSTDDQTESQDELNTKLNETNAKLREQFDLQQKGRTSEINDIQNTIDVMKAQQADESQIISLKLKSIDLEIAKQRTLKQTVKGEKEIFDAEQGLNKLLNEKTVLQIEFNNAIADEIKKRDELNKKIHAENFENDKKNLTLTGIKTSHERINEQQEINLKILNTLKPLIESVYGKQYADAVDDVVAGNKDVGASLMGVAENAKALDKILADNSKNQAEQIEALNKYKDAAFEFATQLGNALANFISGQKKSLAQFASGLAILILDSLQKTIIASIAEITAKSIATLGFAGIATAAAKIALVTAGFESAKAIISKQSEKFESGGEYKRVDVGGNRHSQGGTIFQGSDGSAFEAEQGEGIFIVKRSAHNFINKLSDVNTMFGGRSFNIPTAGNKFEDGGFMVRQMTRDVNIEMSDKRNFIDAVKQIPKPVLIISEMNRVLDSEQQSIDVSNL